ncbi:methyl-accepting chemotaxis protein [Rubidibacter lacunae KORDI 51-2]|uniref:Methyl-accepting chemotaxis protein n=1 Tax=Rubidibacter lacunae KORDI 51-2 TaxID=582515 RepID=U5DFK0_9CHRO|nr:HAMP domain-containing methyl-accepting chemotaxis protein [Rubidibacter lacunae]ERN40376.1 methyl-accepting chemotaxis protein [Rubidibacter lacunae KORDI 51-2]
MTNASDSPKPNGQINGQAAAASAPSELDYDRLVTQIGQANALEEAGELDAARRIYQSVARADPGGGLGASARKALEALDVEHGVVDAAALEPSAMLASEVAAAPAPAAPLRRGWFNNLPIGQKQLLTLGVSELISLSLVGVSSLLLYFGLRDRLVQQSVSELGVAEISYNLQIDQMAFGFRGQSENTAIVEAAVSGSAGDGTVKTILLSEIWSREIEFATLVDTSGRVVVDAGQLSPGSEFNPNGLVEKALKTGEQIKTTELLSYEELAATSARLAELRARERGVDPADAPDFLVRYTVTPVRAPNSEIVGGLVSGDVVKLPVAATTNESFGDGYSAVYLVAPDDMFELETSQLLRADLGNEEASIESQANFPIPDDTTILQSAIDAPTSLIDNFWIDLDNRTYAVAAQAIVNNANEPVAVLVRGTSVAALNKELQRSLLFLLGVAVVAILADMLLARGIAGAIARPVGILRDTTQRFVTGDRAARAAVVSGDEIGELAESFNEMADSITASEAATLEQSNLRQQEANFQRQERERLQQSVLQLLLEIEAAKRGDLTVRANVEEGEMGSVADAFNSTINSLRELVTRVQLATDRLQQSAAESAGSVQSLSGEAMTQARAMTAALTAAEEMSRSVQSVADSAQEAAAIVRQTRESTQAGEAAMDRTVENIDNIRSIAAAASKKTKRLAESSQEISKIIGIISGISEKTNLLAFNASIEAARAGEHGQGFRIVADEVRRLAERVTSSAKEIEQVVESIQTETAEVLQTMEATTEEVVAGTQLVSSTKQSLHRLAEIGQTADELLQSISASAVSQAHTSQTVTGAMQQVAGIAQTTSGESQTVAVALQELVALASELQQSVSRFRIDDSPAGAVAGTSGSDRVEGPSRPDEQAATLQSAHP